ncbi:MAG: hypothetical protein JWO83_3763 [Caulobacteraceae bacterium]|nr:hypothetical protein [Caulobacteraceae bacterium]
MLVSPDKDAADNDSNAQKDRPITNAAKDRIVIALALMGLAGCHGKSATSAPGAAPATVDRPAEATYRAPPVLTSANLLPGGRVRLTGLAGRGDRVRLASPAGQAAYAVAGADGVWSLVLAASAAPRLFGLAMIENGHSIQSEGYVAVTPRGSAAQLRAGAGAVVLGDLRAEPAILAVDFDSKGGTVVSGRAAPRAVVDLWVDGARRGRAATGPGGAFSLPLDEPLSFADHQLEVVEGARRADARPSLSPPAPLSAGPYRATLTPAAWRIDWITPGGGLQTTLLLARTGDAA